MSNIEFFSESSDDIEEGFSWVAKRKIGNQTAVIKFYLSDSYCKGNKHYWWVSFQIYSKRKHIEKNFEDCKITGKCGLEGILFAKDAILEFEKFISTQYEVNENHHFIVVGWADKVRKKIYCHFLPRYGFVLGKYQGSGALIKEVS